LDVSGVTPRVMAAQSRGAVAFLAGVAVVFSAIALLTRTPKTVLASRATTAARYERALGRDDQVRCRRKLRAACSCTAAAGLF